MMAAAAQKKHCRDDCEYFSSIVGRKFSAACFYRIVQFLQAFSE